ncbi:hypothetical protein IscW_ISCW006154 [Ixodes scapularis]|uniref:Uncharacterized protein n=1 Tax=Ixodes scapularis TaxID=6945 RepID=B7PQB4_IXOSC|nr:hypothetical protein IscW_ISCW006154 [Ixodes scapularis]|eukprot:XP_002435956.1 hypothetical protein IscW_ISCW006154 [Ixodes scapularis]
MDEAEPEDAAASVATAAQSGREPGLPATLLGHDGAATTFQSFHEPLTATVFTVEKPTLHPRGHRESAKGMVIAVEQGERYKPEKEDVATDQAVTKSNQAGQEGKLSLDQVPPVAPKDDAHGETGQWDVKGPTKSCITVQPRISP